MGADFSGWATKAGLKCADGRTIMPEAFKHMDGKQVPLVWHHGMSKDVENILGHVILHYKENGDVYTDAYFNDTPKAKSAKLIVQHGDINQLSIMATNLVERSMSVFHGIIREVSLVPAGANPGALIDFVAVRHGDDIDVLDDEAIITTGLTLEHVRGEDDESEESDDTVEHAEGDEEETIEQVIASMSTKQKDVFDYVVGVALGAGEDESEGSDTVEQADNTEDALVHNQEGTPDMGTRNVFDQNGAAATASGTTLSHADELAFATAVWEDMKKSNGATFKEAFLAHAGEYGITNIEELFPDAKQIDQRPEWITRRMDWVEGVINATRKLPFSKIKSASADLTHEEARAKGYIKGDVKKEQFFAVASRETGPKTIYKKQKLDRDDIIDATEFDVVAWLWVEMRFMLREEIARAILIGDGREVDDPDKIDETKIRPIAHDDEFYSDLVVVPNSVNPDSWVETIVRKRHHYKGTSPTAYMTREVLNDMLFLKDNDNRRLYRNKAELAEELEVENIVLVPVMEGATRDEGDILMIIVNLADYAVGSTKGGEITTFEDFDIDVNQHKYLIEGRMSGALVKHKTAQVVVREAGTELVTPDVPTFVPATGVITIPNTTGVVYKNGTTGATLTAGAQSALAAGASFEVEAEPDAGYHFPHNFDADWIYTRPAS